MLCPTCVDFRPCQRLWVQQHVSSLKKNGPRECGAFNAEFGAQKPQFQEPITGQFLCDWANRKLSQVDYAWICNDVREAIIMGLMSGNVTRGRVWVPCPGRLSPLLCAHLQISGSHTGAACSNSELHLFNTSGCGASHPKVAVPTYSKEGTRLATGIPKQDPQFGETSPLSRYRLQ